MIKTVTDLLIKYKELILYVAVGICTTAVNLVAFWLLGKVLGEELYLVSNAAAWLIAVIFAFFMNKLFVFESRSFENKVVFREFAVFFSSRILTFGIEEGGMWLLVDGLSFGEKALTVFGSEIGGQMIAKLIVSILVIIINYLISKFVAFSKRT